MDIEVGLYGKLPTHGDFLRRRVDEDFVQAWDQWLQACIATSRTSLGERWLDLYLTSPVWRFAFAGGVCGAGATAGLMVPSVDRVGRYFPLALVWSMPSNVSPLDAAARYQRLFDQAEHLVLAVLAADQFEFADFDRRVQELSAVLDGTDLPQTGPVSADCAKSLREQAAAAHRFSIIDSRSLQAPALALCAEWLQASGKRALWWTDGSAAVEPSWLITPGLPSPAQYSAMLDGDWHAGGWEADASTFDPSQTLVRPAAPAEPVDPKRTPVVKSAGYSDAGPVRSENQDAFLERPDLRLWAVADGLGGMADGAVASRMVCDALVDAPAAGDLDAAMEGVSGRLVDVNTHLRRQATHPVKPVQSGSTAVVMLMRGETAGVLWAGDSRAYRLREGVLTQLTADHSWQAEGGEPADETVITRAVGGEDSFAADTTRFDLRAGDRFLLCSDGLYRALDVEVLTSLLASGEPAVCSKELVKKALAAGTTDNTTAVVVEYGIEAASLTDALAIVSVDPGHLDSQ